ncbi:hypothetical protein [Sphingobacterium mizutaii]|uniref:hypothetical protein n=1 Tax=Sphingobacterium mizutaii TaxID=1010 RepID=UPI00289F9B27|nr:hypothetical protein [Sphingobacterium mizutaii]
MDTLPTNLFSETVAMLRPNEQESFHASHNTLYHFHYAEDDTFYIYSDGLWYEDVSTAYNFLQIPVNPEFTL